MAANGVSSTQVPSYDLWCEWEQVAFAELRRLGRDAFLALNNGEGWPLETMRLADYGLGHDDRARKPQPVASVLGPRFLAWQLNEEVATSWEECCRHAENIRAIQFKFAQAENPSDESAPKKSISESRPQSSKKQGDLLPPPETELL